MAEPTDGRCHLVVSRLLDYPDPALVADLPVLTEVGASLPQGRLLRPLLGHLEATPLLELQQDYVATFDQRRRCCLYLTYYAYGDTRKRGAALLELKQAYRAAGVELEDGELPDHLCVLLEFAGSVDPAAGHRLLLEHRAGLELLHLSLRDAGSPYAAALAAVSATLPALRGDERDAVRRLVAQGPPGEDVGLDPFGPPTGVPATAGPGPRTAFIDVASVGVRR
ncbi:MAG TPA: nitrate reductase molybdenum cofactor assembly chaperone [Oryzihumus sp.]|nr:nitrate reductase molybdenum cofactor assembly chaperone [Oryzihumus sp.]